MTALVHVVNGSVAAEKVRAALAPRFAGRVLEHRDCLAMGSLVGLAEDPFARVPVWQEMARNDLRPGSDGTRFHDGAQHNVEMLDTLRRTRVVVVWTSNEAADRLGMLRVVAALDGVDNRVFEIDVTPFVRFSHGGVHPVALGKDAELKAAVGALRYLDASERAARTEEFVRWSKSDAIVRGVRDGALVEYDEAQLDAWILSAIPDERLLFAHAVGHAVAGIKASMVGAVLVSSRLCALIERGALTLDGELGWTTGFVTKV